MAFPPGVMEWGRGNGQCVAPKVTLHPPIFSGPIHIIHVGIVQKKGGSYELDCQLWLLDAHLAGMIPTARILPLERSTLQTRYARVAPDKTQRLTPSVLDLDRIPIPYNDSRIFAALTAGVPRAPLITRKLQKIIVKFSAEFPKIHRKDWGLAVTCKIPAVTKGDNGQVTVGSRSLSPPVVLTDRYLTDI